MLPGVGKRRSHLNNGRHLLGSGIRLAICTALVIVLGGWGDRSVGAGGAPPSSRATPITGLAQKAPTGVVIYAATQSYQGENDGTIFRTTTATGMHWQKIWQTPDESPITVIAVAPGGRTIFVASEEGSLWRSHTAGDSFQPVTGIAGVNVLAFAPQHPALIYAGAIKGVYRSTDGGSTWQLLSHGLPNLTVRSIALDPQDPRDVWIGSTEPALLYHSTVAGQSWHVDSSLAVPDAQDESLGAIAVSPVNAHDLYVGTMSSGLYHSTDDGRHWRVLHGHGSPPAGLNRDILSVAFSSLQPQQIYVGTYEGAYASADGGHTWVGARS